VPSRPVMSNNSGPLVAVTGASGYIAGVLIDLLLKKGYRVNGTVRSLADKAKVAHLEKDLSGVRLFEADLLAVGSFKAAFAGCKIIFHTASPFQLSVEDPQRDLVDPALKGTINVIQEALAVETVDTIVVTSSVAATRRWDKPEDYVLTEADWNETASVSHMPYPYSKVVAERAAWDLVAKHNAAAAAKPVRLVCINPSSVIGPPFGTRVDGQSMKSLLALVNGQNVEKGYAPMRLPTIDVRDVAAAHVAAAENPAASGRYLCTSRRTASNEEIASIIRKHFPQLAHKVPDHYAPGNMSVDVITDTSKLERELGIHLIPLETSIVDMITKLIQVGIVTVD